MLRLLSLSSCLFSARLNTWMPRYTAIDVWSAGMILLFFLTRKFPLFHSSDDTEALMELATIIGKKRMEKTATLHSETHPLAQRSN